MIRGDGGPCQKGAAISAEKHRVVAESADSDRSLAIESAFPPEPISLVARAAPERHTCSSTGAKQLMGGAREVPRCLGAVPSEQFGNQARDNTWGS